MLGTPYERGHSEVIVSRDAPDTAIGAGYVCIESGKTIAKFAGTGTPAGVSGYTKQKSIALIKAGLKVRAITDLTSATAGAPVYVTTAGLVTTTDGGNTAINATVSFADSKLANVGEEADGTKYLMIDFVGGF